MFVGDVPLLCSGSPAQEKLVQLKMNNFFGVIYLCFGKKFLRLKLKNTVVRRHVTSRWLSETNLDSLFETGDAAVKVGSLVRNQPLCGFESYLSSLLHQSFSALLFHLMTYECCRRFQVSKVRRAVFQHSYFTKDEAVPTMTENNKHRSQGRSETSHAWLASGSWERGVWTRSWVQW